MSDESPEVRIARLEAQVAELKRVLDDVRQGLDRWGWASGRSLESCELAREYNEILMEDARVDIEATGGGLAFLAKTAASAAREKLLGLADDDPEAERIRAQIARWEKL
ncbi:MAG: hypothetical protein OXO50_00535 [Caldilineaceae bacterium]|nr:hypothetical protein [Caldilineaceae bacterium]